MLGKCATRSLQQSHSFQRAPAHLHHANRLCVVLHALPQTKDVDADITVKIREIAGLGDSLGPIGLTIGGDTQVLNRFGSGAFCSLRFILVTVHIRYHAGIQAQ